MPSGGLDMGYQQYLKPKGLLGFTSNQDIEEAKAKAEAAKQVQADNPNISALARHIRTVWQVNKEHKESQNIQLELIENLRQREAMYDSDTARIIAEQGSTNVFLSLTDVKCRAFENWLSDIFGSEGVKPWELMATPKPEMQDSVVQMVVANSMAKWQKHVAMTGQPPHPEQMFDYAATMREQVDRLISEEADKRAKKMERVMFNQLLSGNWDSTFADFQWNLATFKTAFVKGPIIRKKKQRQWKRNPLGRTTSEIVEAFITEYECPHPLDMFPSRCQSTTDDGDLCERVRFTRRSLRAMLGVPNYDDDAIKSVLENYGKYGYREEDSYQWDRALLERKEKDQSVLGTDMIEGIEFNGSIQGKTLMEEGMEEDPDGNSIDPLNEYELSAILINDLVIFKTFNPNPLGERYYSKCSYRPLAGSFWGKGIPDLMRDLQAICNGAVRALVDNAALSAGPQIVFNDISRIPTGEDIENIYPRKIWQFINQMNQSGNPIDFRDIPSHATELFRVYESFAKLADDWTGVPAYQYGNSISSGAGRTSSGLQTLMAASGRGIKKAIARIDTDIFRPCLLRQFEFNMAYNPDESIKGDVTIRPVGELAMILKEGAMQKTQQILQASNNPIDIHVIKPSGRAILYKRMMKAADIDSEDVVTDSELLEAIENAPPPQVAQQAGAPGMVPGVPQPAAPAMAGA